MRWSDLTCDVDIKLVFDGAEFTGEDTPVGSLVLLFGFLHAKNDFTGGAICEKFGSWFLSKIFEALEINKS